MQNRLKLIVLSGCAILPLAARAAPKLNWPLPVDSLEQNGTLQIVKTHKLTAQKGPVLPLATLHPRAEAGLKRVYSGTPIDVLNYHYDTYPTGWNQSETDLTPSSVASTSFGLLKTLQVDGNVFAQPLLVSNFVMPDGTTHNVLIIATGHNSVYAYDAQDYKLLWRVGLGKPQTSSDVGCSDVIPEYGISSTPVIVRNGNTATIYVVSASEPAALSFHTKLHAIDLGTGKNIQTPHEIAPQHNIANGGVLHFDPQNQWNRTSLVYKNGSIYVGVGSHCDNNSGSISGWMLQYDATTLKIEHAFPTIKAAASLELASIWMSGYPPAVDDAGDILAVTGNGNYNTTTGSEGWGESILAWGAQLGTLKGAFTPSDWQALNDDDQDLGSGGVMAIPMVAGQAAPPLAVAMGKEGRAYLVNISKLGGTKARGSTDLQDFAIATCFCAPAYYMTPAGGMLFYQASNDVVRAYAVNVSATPSLNAGVTGTVNAGFGGSFPIISSNAGTAGTAIVWALERGSTMQLQAYNAASLGAPLYQGNSGTWSNGSRGWLTPVVANGRVYAPATGSVTVFGLTD